ncbi:MAG: PQ-loop repeat-containing protein [Candidatus Levybacteria bacterium]|nr:PQ-loop repeat-containing protein [Candidatus Levybacteria bacterium]
MFATITFTAIVGFLTIALGILVKLVGFPDQIRRNYKNKSTQGLSTAFMVLSFIAYAMWTLHGILINDMVVVIGQGLGIITTGAILWQIYVYRKPS